LGGRSPSSAVSFSRSSLRLEGFGSLMASS
jgi:hypothetical protein